MLEGPVVLFAFVFLNLIWGDRVVKGTFFLDKFKKVCLFGFFFFCYEVWIFFHYFTDLLNLSYLKKTARSFVFWIQSKCKLIWILLGTNVWFKLHPWTSSDKASSSTFLHSSVLLQLYRESPRVVCLCRITSLVESELIPHWVLGLSQYFQLHLLVNSKEIANLFYYYHTLGVPDVLPIKCHYINIWTFSGCGVPVDKGESRLGEYIYSSSWETEIWGWAF